MNKIEDYSIYVEELINKRRNSIKEFTSVLNNDKPIFEKQDYEIIEGEPKYFEPDEQGRATGAIALVGKNTIPLVIKKKLKYPNPYGWNENFENKNVFERCHIIAYSLSAKLADKRNIFIGTKTLNKSIMSKVEKRVKKYVEENDVRVLYKVTVKYKGNNQIPKGVLIEAQSLDDEFSVCQFCYNVQKDATFDYNDGTIIKYNKVINALNNTVQKVFGTKKNNKKHANGNLNYIINRKTNKFHLKDNGCNSFKNIDSKYINETTATEKDLIKAGLDACEKCMKDKV